MLTIVRSISAGLFCFPFAVATGKAAQDDWLTYRHDSARTGAQAIASDLSDPAKVSNMHVVAQFPPEGSLQSPGGSRRRPSLWTARPSSAASADISMRSTQRPARLDGSTRKPATTP
jgi:hypothetical protein